MLHRRLLGATLVLSAALVAQEPSGPRLTAREIFYGAQAPTAPAQKAKTPAKKIAKSTPPKKQSPSQKSEPTPVVLAAHENVSGSPGGLAMRWSIVQNLPGGVKKEVPATTEFKSGDAINVRVEVNDFGYLYILARGSSGKWTPLFPSAQMAGGDNRVGPNQPYVMPAGFVFRFDDNPGTERIFVVFSRKPEPDFDTLLYKVAPDRQPSDAKPSEAAPAPTPAAKPHPGIILAQNSSIGDPFVDRMKTLYARDLIVEKVEGEAKSSLGPKMEYAAYVASPRKDDPRVVAEVSLVHK
ncbi:MAG: DUF4384 domain-containing protein [Bryobacter sp.]|nr:DUF4384 domain-containing protein [Bryobacter sp.]